MTKSISPSLEERAGERSTSRPRRALHAAALTLALLIAGGCQSHPVAHASSPGAVEFPAFDMDRAFGYLKAQCDFGPRVPNTQAHDDCRDYIIKELTPNVDKVDTQVFAYRDRKRGKRLMLTNIIGVINPTAAKKVMLFTHWDTRPTADQELDDVNKAKPIPGADDGASGTAVLLELARTFHDKHPDVGVILLFVDGEDWGPDDDNMYIGAKFFATHPGDYRPQYAILLDMIGDRNLQIHREHYSEEHQPEIDNKIWGAAKDLGYTTSFVNDTKYEITDDHQPMNDAGIPAVDLIDFDYPYWHTLADTPDKCSPVSLKTVGQVCARVIYQER
jgi:glutaminyl-peptide cyclotransferase